VQDAAVEHWTTTAPAAEQERLFWVVLRHEIDYLHAAPLDDQIVARTWVGIASRLRFERHTEILRTDDGRVPPGRALCGVISTRSAASPRR
jgi:acyl-CoA thioester hydrolase